MTKHEFHIALILIALIAVGVLGYNALNNHRFSHIQTTDCTLALYFSGPNGCYNTPKVKSISAPVFAKKIESYFSRGLKDYDISQYEIDKVSPGSIPEEEILIPSDTTDKIDRTLPDSSGVDGSSKY